MRLLAGVLATAGLFQAGLCVAQTMVSPNASAPRKVKPPQGIVTGTAYCSDTDQPARLAQILLVPLSASSLSERQVATTDLEGRFAARHIPEGTYYVSAVLPGYVNSLAGMIERLKSMTPEERKAFDALQTTITISATQAAKTTLRLERGAEIDGTVLYDDGSPGISLQMNVKPKISSKADTAEDASDSLESYMEANSRTTDDHGRFRIVGLPPGEYLVSATVPTLSADPVSQNLLVEMIQSSPFGGLLVYAGGSLRASEAKLIKVGPGEVSGAADITIPLGSLHSIHGSVILKSTGQLPPAAGLQLLYADNQEIARTSIAADGEFDMPYVPEGNYILRAVASSEPIPALGQDDDGDELGAFSGGIGIFVPASGMKLHEGAEIPLLVKGDINNVTISVPDPQPIKKPAASSAQDMDTDGTKIAVPQ